MISLTEYPDKDGLPTRSVKWLFRRDGVVDKILLALDSQTFGLLPSIILLGSGELRFHRPPFAISCDGDLAEWTFGTGWGADEDITLSWSKTRSKSSTKFTTWIEKKCHSFEHIPWFQGEAVFRSELESFALMERPFNAECQLSALLCLSRACWRNKFWIPCILCLYDDENYFYGTMHLQVSLYFMRFNASWCFYMICFTFKSQFSFQVLHNCSHDIITKIST